MTTPIRQSTIARSNVASSSSEGAIEALVDAATVTPNGAKRGGYLAQLSQATLIANPSGTPVSGAHYVLEITSTTSRNLTYGSLIAGSAALPLPAATTGGGATDYLGLWYSATRGRWFLLAKSMGY